MGIELQIHEFVMSVAHEIRLESETLHSTRINKSATEQLRIVSQANGMDKAAQIILNRAKQMLKESIKNV